MGTTLNIVLDDLKYYPNHSHNSWVEMTLSLGQVGNFLLSAIIGIAVIFAIMRVRSSHGAYYTLPFLTAALLIGSFESVLTYPSNFGGALLILVAAKVVRKPLITERQKSLRGIFNCLGQYVIAKNTVPPNPLPA